MYKIVHILNILLQYSIIHTYYTYVLYGNIHSHSPTGTGGTHTLGEETNEATIINDQYDEKVVYAAPAQTVTIPHQTSATGDMYAVSTKVVGKASQEQPPAGEGNGVHDVKSDPPKKDTGGVSS